MLVYQRVTILKNDGVRQWLSDDIPYMYEMEHKIHVPNHQPAVLFVKAHSCLAFCLSMRDRLSRGSYWRSSHWWVKWGCCYPSMLPEWFSIKRSWCSQFWGCPVAIKPGQCQKKSIWSHCHVIVIVNDEIVFGTDQSPISSNGFVSKIRYVIPSHGWQNYIP